MKHLPTIIVIIVFILTCCIVPYLGLIVLVIFFIYTGLKSDQPITKSSNLTTQDTPEVLLFSFRENKRAYLRSELWKFKKKERLKLDKYTCQSCGITGVELHIHHLSEYNNLGYEDINSLISLCSSCHTYQHEQLGYPQTYEEYMNWNVKLIKKDK